MGHSATYFVCISVSLTCTKIFLKVYINTFKNNNFKNAWDTINGTSHNFCGSNSSCILIAKYSGSVFDV